MKTLITLIIGFFLSISLHAMDFELMPTNISFVGNVVSGEHIIAYGNHGAYMMTTDKGASWKQYSLHERGVIWKMVDYNDTLWAIIDEGYIARSVDNGITWIKKKYDFDKEEGIFASMAVNDDNLYIRGMYTIYRFDKEMNLQNYLRDSCFLISIHDLSHINWDVLSINRRRIFNNCNNNLLLECDTHGGFYRVSNTLDEYKFIDLNFINDESKLNSIYDILKFQDKTVYQINYNYYYTDETFTNWTYFFEDPNFYNCFDASFAREHYIDRNFTIYNNKLFFEKTPNSEGIDFPNSGYNGSIIYDLQLYHYDWDIKDYVTLNNKFVNNYFMSAYAPDANVSALDMLLSSSLAKPTFLGDSIIIKSNLFKSLLQTRDACKSWELVSVLHGEPNFILNDSAYYFINNIDDYANDIQRTFDSGNTFLPTECGLDSLPYASDSSKFYKTSYFQNYKTTSVFYIGDDGVGFWAGPYKYANHALFAITRDYGRTYQFIPKNKLYCGYKDRTWTACPVKYIDGHYLFSMNYEVLEFYPHYLNRIYIFDTTFNVTEYIVSDSLYTTKHILADNLQHFYLFTITQDPTNFYKEFLAIRETNDGGKTNQIICRSEDYIAVEQVHEQSKDSVFICTAYPARLYLWTRQKNELELLYDGDPSGSLGMFVLNDRFYLYDKELFLENTDRDDLTQWAPGSWDYGTPNIETVIFKGNVALAKLSDDVRDNTYYRITPKKPTGIRELEKKYYTTEFWASEPYPTPASDKVTCRVAWDMSYDLQESVQGVYNLYGVQIEGKEHITLNTLGKASTELTWNCSEVTNGLYFIVVEHHGKTDCIPVIVNK